MKKLLFILNPRAGKQKANKLLPQILNIFEQAGYQVHTHKTTGPMDAAQAVARMAKDVELVVCCGGDGTFNETVDGLMSAGVDIPIGYIPAGSTNDLANSLRLPTKILEAARTAVTGTPHRLDIGLFGQRHFTYVASFGAFTRISYAVSQKLKNALGHAAYILSSVGELFRIRKTHVRLELDGEIVEDDFIFGAISNSTSVGGVLTLDPKVVDMADGKFEVLLIRPPKGLDKLCKCIRQLRKRTYASDRITFRSASRIRIWADGAMDWSLDGEFAPGSEEICVSNLHRAIQIMKKDESK